MTKVNKIADRIKHRIATGDYASGLIPPERALAASLGACQVTARKAIQQLVAEGVLIRMGNGRLKIELGCCKSQIALLAPAWGSPEFNRWYITLVQAASAFDCILKVVYYYHWDDPVIPETISQYDGCFFFTSDPKLKKIVRDLLKIGKPLFSLNNDWTDFGVPSLLEFPPQYVTKIMEHFYHLGHRRIDCINIQPEHATIPSRIGEWSKWISAHGVEGKLYNNPVAHYEDPWPQAYKLVDRLLRQDKLKGKAFYCVTQAAAFSTIKALADHGLRVGIDVAVATSDSSEAVNYSTPTVTSISLRDMSPQVIKCLDWLVNGKAKDWKGSLLLQPDNIELVVRQSTVPDIESRCTPQRMLNRKSVGR